MVEEPTEAIRQEGSPALRFEADDIASRVPDALRQCLFPAHYDEVDEARSPFAGVVPVAHDGQGGMVSPGLR